MVVLISESGTDSRKLRAVIRKGVALLALISGDYGVRVFECKRGDVQTVLVREILQVQLGRRALRHAHGSVFKFERTGYSEALVDKEALPVVEHRLRVVAPLSVAAGRPCNGAYQHIDFAGLDGRPAALRR